MKEAPLQTALFNNTSAAAGVNTLIPALSGHKVRVYAYEASYNTPCQIRWYNSVSASDCGPRSYVGANSSWQANAAAADRFLFETANDQGLNFYTSVATVFGMCVNYAYIPNGY